MKIIKSLLLLTLGFYSTALLYAQEPKTEVAKPMEIKTPAAAANKIPSPASEFKPQPGTVPKETASSAAKPAPEKNDTNKEPAEEPKAVALTIDADAATKKLTPEQLKIFNGTKEKPKEPVVMPNTIDNNMRPVPTKPAVLKAQQQ